MEQNGIVLNFAKKIHAHEVDICKARGKKVDYEVFNEKDEMGTLYVELAQRILAGLVLR